MPLSQMKNGKTRDSPFLSRALPPARLRANFELLTKRPYQRFEMV
jgi:hypothetical protein